MTGWHEEETYKSLIQIALGALRFVLFANGGAALALLAFLGSVWGKSTPPPDVSLPLGLFLGGVFFGGVAHIGAYLTQLVLYNEDLGITKGGMLRRHETWLYGSLFCIFLGVLAFGVGAYMGVESLSK